MRDLPPLFAVLALAAGVGLLLLAAGVALA